MTAATADDKREQINFISVDSAPKRFAGFIPQWRGFAVLGTFTLLAFTLLWAINQPALAAIFPNRDLVFSPYDCLLYTSPSPRDA